MAAKNTYFYQSLVINIPKLKLKGFKSHYIFQNQNTTAPVTMEMKYLQVGISNYAEIPLVLTNHLG